VLAGEGGGLAVEGGSGVADGGTHFDDGAHQRFRGVFVAYGFLGLVIPATMML